MKKTRKLTALLLALTMCITGFALTGCGDSGDENQGDEQKETLASEEATEAETGPTKTKVDKIDMSAEWEYDFQYDDPNEGYSRNGKVMGTEKVQYVSSKLFAGKLAEGDDRERNILVVHMHEELTQNVVDADGNSASESETVDPDLLTNVKSGNALAGHYNVAQMAENKDTGEMVNVGASLFSDLMWIDINYGSGSDILNWLRSEGCDISSSNTAEVGSFYGGEGAGWIINRKRNQEYSFYDKETSAVESFYLYELSRADVPVTLACEVGEPSLLSLSNNATISPEKGTKQTMIIELPQ